MLNTILSTQYKISSLLLLLGIAGCMYPGMDNTNVKLGQNTQKTLNSQAAFPDAGIKNRDKILSNTDGERGSLILENHRQAVSTIDDLEQPININIGGK